MPLPLPPVNSIDLDARLRELERRRRRLSTKHQANSELSRIDVELCWLEAHRRGRPSEKPTGTDDRAS